MIKNHSRTVKADPIRIEVGIVSDLEILIWVDFPALHEASGGSNITRHIVMFLTFLFPGVVSVSDGHVELAPLNEEWKVLLAHYAGPTAILVVALLLAVILPLAGSVPYILWLLSVILRDNLRTTDGRDVLLSAFILFNVDKTSSRHTPLFS